MQYNINELNENKLSQSSNNLQYSVLMAVYHKDSPFYLKCAIDSMLSQSISPEQFVIVIDGNITDELENVLKKYSSNKIFTLVRLEENRGLANALNSGLKHCRNELIARMDADDISLKERCEKELSMFAKYSDLAVCGCNIGEFSDDPDKIDTYRIVPSNFEEIKRFSRRRQPFNHPAVIYKKSVIEKNGGYENLKRKEDFDLFSRLIVSGEYVLNINEVLYLYRANKDNYKRRKSKDNLLAALNVYWKHRKRGGCNWGDYLVMSFGEIVFMILPLKIMKLLSDSLLRTKVLRSGKIY